MKNKLWLRTLSLLLAVILCMQCGTYIVFAETDDTAEPTQAAQQADPEPVGELTEKRTANEKYFMYSDQSTVVAVYPEAVHYQDENGTWQEIDNRLTEDDTDGEAELSNTANAWKIKFAKKAKDGKLAKLKYGDHTIKWYLSGAEKTKVTALPEEEAESNDPYYVSRLTSGTVYEDILPHIDLEYRLVGEKIKENIILNSADAAGTFTFVYETGALEMQLQDGVISLNDGEQTVLKLDAPVMTDAAGQASTDIVLSLHTDKATPGNHIYSVTVTPDAGWLADEQCAFPVTVDPTLTTEQAYEKILDTYVSKLAPSSNYTDYSKLKVGMDSTTGDVFRSYLQFVLPQNIGESDRVVHATLNLYPDPEQTNLDDMATHKPAIQAHAVTDSWDNDTLTWNEQPTFDSTVLDYDIIGAENGSENAMRMYRWDITELVDDWYTSGTNNGVMLKLNSETGYTGDKVARFCSSELTGYTNNSDAFPMITITYLNMLGLEDYWTYHSLDAGLGGTAYINDFTGGLTIVTPVASVASEIMPINISLVYSPGSNDSSVNKLTVAKDFMLNVQSYTKKVTIGGVTKYKYVDDDGTIHYFEEDNGVWKDDAGLGLTLSDSGGYYTITDKQDNHIAFYADTGRLSRITDNNGNRLQLYYNAETLYLERITNNTHSIYFEQENGRLVRIKYPDTDGKTRYAQITHTDYNNNIQRLTQYVDQNGTYVPTDAVSYPCSNGVVSGIVSCPYDPENPPAVNNSLSGTALRFGFNVVTVSGAKRRRVTSYRMCPYTTGTDGTAEYSYTVTYGDRSTLYEQKVSGSTLGKELYTFDTLGRTITAQDQDGNALFQAYGLSGGSENKVTFSSGTQRNVSNLLKNHNFEKGSATVLTNWTKHGNTDDNAAIKGTAESEPTFIGDKAMKVYKHNSAQTVNSEVKQYLTLEGGKVYTFSAYVRTEFETLASVSNRGAFLAVENGDYSLQYYKHNIISNNSFTRYFVTVDLTGQSGSQTFGVIVGIERAKGVAYFDGLQLEEGSSVNSYNLVENAGFEDTTDWTEENTGDVDGFVTDYSRNSKMFKFTGNPKLAKKLVQTIPVNGKKNDGLTAGVWLKCNTLPDKDTQSTGAYQTCAITLELVRADGTSQYATQSISGGNAQWRYICLGAVAKKDYTDVKIYLKYLYNCNVAYFDNVCLFKDTFGQSFTYDDNGNVQSVVDKANNTTNIKNNAVNEVESYTDANNNTYNFTYDTDNPHLLTKVTNPNGSKEEITYNEYGNPVKTTASSAGNGFIFNSSTTYTDDGHYVDSETDYAGATTYYSRDESTGRIETVHTPLLGGMHLGTQYEYDPLTKEITAVHADGIPYTLDENNKPVWGMLDILPTRVEYSYDRGNLTDIVRTNKNTVTKKMGYHMTYDAAGKRTGVYWSGKSDTQYPLQTTAYYAQRGLVKSVSYGNGQTVGYTYNNGGTLTGRTYDGKTVASYEYNAKNALGAVTYYRTHTKAYAAIHYEYDLAGRVSGSWDSRGYTTSNITYDANNNLTNVTSALSDSHASIGHGTVYTYNDMNQMTSLVNRPIDGDDGGTLKYSYDTANRLNKMEVMLDADGTQTLTTTQTYKANADGTRTLLPSTRHVYGQLNNAGFDVSYYSTYLPDQNIESQRTTENGKKFTANYDYDYLGQLTEAVNTVTANSVTTGVDTYAYTYDDGGNLLTKTYSVQDADDTTAISPADDYTASYSYDSNMTDLLTGYTKTASDGTVTSNTYDYTAANGSLFVNPTTITKSTDGTVTDTLSLTWEQGRQLSSIVSNAGTTLYEYDHNGLRTYRKQADGTTHYYYYNGTQLDYLKIVNANGGLTALLHFIYDSNGQVQYILRKHNYKTTLSANYDLYYVVRDNAGVITKLLKVRGGTSTGSTYAFQLVAEYEYDPYGKPTAIKTYYDDLMGTFNPFIYKDYLYDFDTGWYYLQSRYYDPEVGRFLNGDKYIFPNMIGSNLFAYCNNNPINYADTSGENALTNWIGGMYWLTIVDATLPIGDFIYYGGIVVCAVITGVVYVESTIDNAESETSKEKTTDAPTLPNQGEVSEIPDAPPVDAGKQGKHVPGHNNNNPNKTQWNQGETGVKETQEAWKNGVKAPNNRQGTIKIGKASDGRLIKVHQDSSGRIHGYPIFP